MCLILALLDRKGGVGKTSLTRDLGGAYAAAGRRVLLLDLDPQASLTKGLLGPPATEALPPGATIAALFDDDPPPARLIRPTTVERLAIVPGSRAMDRLNTPEPWRSPAHHGVVRSLVRAVAGDYDAVLIDCPPNIYLCTWMALFAARWAVVPLEPDDYGAREVACSVEAIYEAQSAGAAVDYLGLVVTQLQPRLAVHQLYLENLLAGHGNAVMTNMVPLSADVKAAAMLRLPLAQHKPRCAAARAVRALADEIWLRADLADRRAEKGAA